jgi:hypothetical protein
MEETNSTSIEASTTRGVMDRVREGATSQLSSQKDRAMDGLAGLARAVRQSTQSFRDIQQDTVAEYVERAGHRIEQLSVRLRERDATELLQDAQRFARRRPLVFIGTAFALGVVATRFLKSSGIGIPENGYRDSAAQRPAGSALEYGDLSSRLDRSMPRRGSAGGDT